MQQAAQKQFTSSYTKAYPSKSLGYSKQAATHTRRTQGPGSNANIKILVYIQVTSKQSLANRKAASLETIRGISQRITLQMSHLNR